MWNSDFYAARPHRVGSPSSSTAPTPPPKEVLSADLARPISVRELAQSRVPAVPPPRASTSYFSSGNSSGATYLNGAHLPPSPRTSGDFAGFGVPRAPVVYAATSGVLPNWAPTARTTVTVPPAELSTYGEASDLASLAERHIDRFSHDDLYNYASHLQDTAKRYSNNLSEAYTARNMYREQVAQLKQELQQKTLQVDLQRRDRERCDAAVQKLREDNTQLRLQLAEAEGQTRNIAARLSLQNGADPSVVIRAYQAQLAQRDAQLRELTERLACESSVAEARQGSGDGDGEADTRPSRALGAAESNDDRLQRQQQLREEEIKAATAQTVAAATAELQAELNDLQQRKAALERQLTAQETAHAAALARCAAERTELQVTIERARQEQAEMQENEDALIAALAQRAPVSKANFEALQTSFAETQAALTKAEAAVATLQEQQRTVAAQEGYVEVLQQALATGQAERQELTDQNRQLQSLVDNLQREVELADTANQLRQQQLETALQGGEQLAEQVQHAEAMHAAHMSEEIGALQERCAASEAEMQRLQSENEELHRQLQELPVSQTATHASHLVASDMANLEREKAELAAEVETLRGARDSLVVYRDSLVNEVRELEERRQRCSAELEAAQLRNTAAQLEAEAPVSAAPPSPLDDEEDTEEHGVMLQAARQCIAALQQDLETERADHAHAEADAHAQLLALERTVAEQRAALRTAEEQRTHAEAAAQNTVVERLTNLNTMHETLMTRAAAVTAERDALRQRAAAAEEEVRTVKAALEELAGDLSSTTQRADTAAAANEALQAENAAMKTELSVARSAAASIASERDSRREDDGAAHERLEAAEARARAAATECEGMQQRLRTAEENDRTAVAALEAMAEKLSDAEARAEALTSENGALTQAKTQLTAERDDAQRRVAAAGENERTLKAAVEELAAKLAAADQHVEDLTAQTGSLEAERAQLCSERDAAQRVAEVSEGNTSAAKAALERMVEDASALEQRASCLTAANAQLTAERDAMQQRVAAAEEEVRTVKAALEELAGDLSSTTQRADTAAAANEALQAENAAMKTELSVARSAAASIASERDSRREDDGAAHERLEAAEARARAAATECEGMQQRLRTAEENDRTAVAALEAMAEKLSDAEARAEALTSENGALTQAKTQLTAERDDAQRRVAAAGENERTLKAAVEELAAKLAAADQHVEDLTAQTGSLEAERAQLCSERDTLRQRVSDAAEELQSVKAALEDLAAECSDTKQRADALAAQVAGLEGERLKLLAELEHAHVVLAEVEVRLADAEHRDSERTAAMEHLSAAQLAQIASLEEQTSQLKKELSTARAAISTMAEHRADTETQISDLQSQLNHASEQRKTEEKTASALRSELAVARAAVAQLADDLATHAADDTALRAAAQAQDEAVALLRTKHEEDNAELMELRRRAEELRGVLSTTLDRLAQKEELEKQLNDNAGELAANNAALTEELATLRQTLEMALAEERELLERLDAANRGVEQTASMYNERILDMDRLQGELDAVTQAFAAQTEQLKSGLTRVVGMSDGFRRAVEAAMAPAATTVRATAKLAADASSYVFEDCEGREAGAACSVSAAVAAVKAALTPWSETLDWVAATRQRIEELEGSRANAGAGHEDFSTASADGAAAATTDARSQAGEDSPASSYLSEVSQARSALLDFVEQQTTSLAHLRRLRHALHERDQAAVDKQAALEAVAGGAVDAQERADGLFRATEDARHRILQAEREWEEQLQLKSQATAAELIVARRAEERANDARTRAEAQLAAAEKELKETQAALRTTQEEKQKLALQTERLSLLSSQQSDSSALQRRRGSVGDSVTPPTAAVSTGSRTTRYTVSSSTEEAVEQTHLLQVAGLQQELVRCRRQIRELESEEATLRQAYMALEQEVSDLRSDAAEVVNLRAEMATLRADYADSEERYERLRLMVDAVGDGTAQENRRLRQELKLKDAELEEYKTRQENSLVSRGAPDFETQRLEEAFRQSMSGIATQLTAKQAEFSGGHHGGNSFSASPQDVLNSRIDHLQTLVRERDAVISKMKAADLQSRVKCEGLEEKLAEKTAALNGAEELLAQYMERLDAMRAAGLAAAVTTRATTTPQRNTGKSSRERAKRDSALPPTPLSLNVTDGSTSTSHKGATPAGLAMPSPAPRMPNLDDVAAGSGEEDEEDEVRKINGNGSEDDASATPPATSRRRTGATGENSSCGNRRTREVHSSSSGTTPPRASPKVGKTVSTRKRAR